MTKTTDSPLIEKGIFSVIYVSSASVYSDDGESPFSETVLTVANNTYVKAKLNNEKKYY